MKWYAVRTTTFNVGIVFINKGVIFLAKNITGNNDGESGRNETYTIIGRGVIPRKTLVMEIENGRHPDFSIYEINGEKFVRSAPDSTESNNVNKRCKADDL